MANMFCFLPTPQLQKGSCSVLPNTNRIFITCKTFRTDMSQNAAQHCVFPSGKGTVIFKKKITVSTTRMTSVTTALYLILRGKCKRSDQVLMLRTAVPIKSLNIRHLPYLLMTQGQCCLHKCQHQLQLVSLWKKKKEDFNSISDSTKHHVKHIYIYSILIFNQFGGKQHSLLSWDKRHLRADMTEVCKTTRGESTKTCNSHFIPPCIPFPTLFPLLLAAPISSHLSLLI